MLSSFFLILSAVYIVRITYHEAYYKFKYPDRELGFFEIQEGMDLAQKGGLCAFTALVLHFFGY